MAASPRLIVSTDRAESGEHAHHPSPMRAVVIRAIARSFGPARPCRRDVPAAGVAERRVEPHQEHCVVAGRNRIYLEESSDDDG